MINMAQTNGAKGIIQNGLNGLSCYLNRKMHRNFQPTMSYTRAKF